MSNGSGRPAQNWFVVLFEDPTCVFVMLVNVGAVNVAATAVPGGVQLPSVKFTSVMVAASEAVPHTSAGGLTPSIVVAEVTRPVVVIVVELPPVKIGFVAVHVMNAPAPGGRFAPLSVKGVGIAAGKLFPPANAVTVGARNVTVIAPAEPARAPEGRITSTSAVMLTTPQITTAGVVDAIVVGPVIVPATSAVDDEPAANGVPDCAVQRTVTCTPMSSLKSPPLIVIGVGVPETVAGTIEVIWTGANDGFVVEEPHPGSTATERLTPLIRGAP
jgi:hypothetical protein